MNATHRWIRTYTVLLAAATLAGAVGARGDVVTDANARAAAVASRTPATPVAVRALAMVQVSVFEAVNAITGRYLPYGAKIVAAPDASVAAAVAAATRTALLKLMPAEATTIEADYQAAMKPLSDDPGTTAGVAVGEQAAAAVLAARAGDGAAAPDNYRPYTTAGIYVPTSLPAVPRWGERRPWVMASGDQFRPGPPPSLVSDVWTRDYDESKAFGARNSTARTAEQTAVARFWEGTAPAVFWHIACSVATAPGRDVTDNARLLAVAGMAMDDAVIAVFDAKYAYNFWRPITAIRNGDLDGNDATALDPGWTPLIDTPLHPEYPCAHCIVSGALGAVLDADIGTGTTPTLTSVSPTAPGVVRTWASVDDFVQEVAVARIHDGVHFRNSTAIGTAMGKVIGDLAVKTFPGRTH